MNDSPVKQIIYSFKYPLFVILWVFTFLLVSNTGIAQENSSRGIDNDKYNFGFILGINTNNFRLVRKENPHLIDSTGLQQINSSPSPGFNIGIVSNLKINKYFDLRFTPALSFVDRLIDYQFKDPNQNISKSVESNYLDFPLALKYKSKRHRNVRIFVIAGIKYSYDVISIKRITASEDQTDPTTRKVKVLRNTWAYEYGIGFDFYYPYFKLSPELRFSNGLSDILQHEDHFYASVLDKLFTRAVTLSFNFE